MANKLENKFKTKLVNELKETFPNCIVVHLDPNEIQGIPDIMILHNKIWASLEVKKSKDETKQPNQEYYVDIMDTMSFSRFIYPENKDCVISELKQYYESEGVANV